jgi:peptidoglycan/xylan/chitin deacetylase (PgdA/CDA1 family)
MSQHVALTFDVDALSLWIGSFGHTSPGVVSRGEFDVVGTQRVLDLLAEHSILATFFVPGHTAHAFPAVVEAITAGGHEIGHHGYVHERVGALDRGAERAILEAGFTALDAVAGVRPVGYRSPSWDFTESTVELLEEFGFTYDSSLMASDFVPYHPRRGDGIYSDRPYAFGVPSPLLELPVSWVLDDFPYFEYVRGVTPGLRNPDDVLAIWSGEFDEFVAARDAGCFTVTMHPQVIGRRPRLTILRRLIERIAASPEVRFATLREVAEVWRAREAVAVDGAAGA